MYRDPRGPGGSNMASVNDKEALNLSKQELAQISFLKRI